MKLNKYILMTSALLLGAAGAFADDFDDFGSFGDDSSSGSGFENSSPKIEVSGTVATDVRAYVDVDDDNKDEKIEVEAKPTGTLALSYGGNMSDLELVLCMDADRIKNHPEDIIDELLLRGRLGDYFTVEAGKLKVVWGKGDKLHVLDNFNADDYSNFIIPDYIDRRVSTPMLRGIISLPAANLNIEGIYTPLLPVDRFAMEGKWTPAQFNELTGAATSAAEMYIKKLVTDCETYRTGLAAATTLAKSSEEQAKAAKAAADEYASKMTQYTNNISQLNTGIAQVNAGIDQVKAGITAAQAAGQTATVTALQAQLTTLTTQLATLTSQLQQATIALVHCTAEKEAQLKAAQKYTSAAKEASTQAADYKTKLTSADTAYTLALNNTTSLANNIYPNLWTLKYGQFGGRATWTLGQIDMGISYYNGWYKQPSINGEKLYTFIEKYLSTGAVSEEDKFLAYDKKQTFGVEASSIIWHFNVRGEFAYNLTNDTDGTDPWVHNNSIAWLGGFDIDLPFWNANLNVQEIGTYILKSDECDKNAYDVDYAKNGYTNNKLAVNFTTSFLNDKVAPEVTVMYGFENKDLVVMPKLAFKADQNLTLNVSGMIINCGDDDSDFKAWEKNSFVSVGAKYQF